MIDSYRYPFIIPDVRCPKCKTPSKGYHHEANGCGLVNTIRLKTTHLHYYCRCGHEYTRDIGLEVLA